MCITLMTLSPLVLSPPRLSLPSWVRRLSTPVPIPLTLVRTPTSPAAVTLKFFAMANVCRCKNETVSSPHLNPCS